MSKTGQIIESLQKIFTKITISDTLNGTILQNNIKTAAARRQIDF